MWVKQPNGKYARWSGVVDHFTHVNCSLEQIIAVKQDVLSLRVAAEAERGVAWADALPEQWESLRKHCIDVHGTAALDEIDALLVRAEEEEEEEVVIPTKTYNLMKDGLLNAQGEFDTPIARRKLNSEAAEAARTSIRAALAASDK